MIFYRVKYFFSRVRLFFATFYVCYKEYKLSIIALAIFGFFGALMEGIGINALIPLFSLITTKSGGGTDFISVAIEKLFLFLNIEFRLKYLLVFIAFLFVFKAIFLVLSEYIRVKISADYEERTRNKLFKKFFNSNWSYLLKQKLGHLQSVLIVNVENSAKILSYFSSFIIIFTSLVVYIFIAININLKITLFALLLSGFLFLIFVPFVRKIRNFSYILEKLNRDIGHHVNENIFGMKTVKVMSVSDQVVSEAKKNFRELKITKVIVSIWQTVISSLMQPISLIFVLLVFAVSYKTPGFNLASFIAIIYLIKQIFSYTEALQKKVVSFNATIPYFKSIAEYERETEKYKELDEGTKEFKFNNSIKIKNVEFTYETGKKVLSGINFEMKKGEMVGLIGSSGAGKTTIVDLILRLFNPTKGEILLDENNINTIKQSEWKSKIGYVSQDIFLMNDTIANNIKFYNNKLKEEEIEAVAKMANIYDFIQTLPNKFDTIMGERGVELSAGQRQRVVIARVLARKPEILILDEATSALDNESELKIQKVIENLKGKITVFVIAHRLSTIVNCDKLLVLENGKIIEEGSPKKLLEDKKSYFYKVYNIRNNNK